MCTRDFRMMVVAATKRDKDGMGRGSDGKASVRMCLSENPVVFASVSGQCRVRP